MKNINILYFIIIYLIKVGFSFLILILQHSILYPHL
jgi:hypothetical protein